MFTKFLYLTRSIFGEVLKWLCKLHIIRPPKKPLKKSNRERSLVLSLTSYGRRVLDTVPYTIISLLRQSFKPDELILWLDDTNWSEENIPKSLKRLQKFGLTIEYCDDIRSYKKLIPTLINRPDSIVITTDDDVYYPSDMVERLHKEYQKNPNRVYCNIAHSVKVDSVRGLCGYKEWNGDVYGESGPQVFPVGVGCILYDPRLLYKDVTRKELFTQLSPLADDVWFYFMELLNGTECCVLERRKMGPFYPIDTFYQALHKDSNLVKQNVGEDMNDRQIRNVMEYYGIIADKEKGVLRKC
jgi:hypothetical protein